jgi:hypothetical protein
MRSRLSSASHARLQSDSTLSNILNETGTQVEEVSRLSREAAQEYSPGRKPRESGTRASTEGAKEDL